MATGIINNGGVESGGIFMEKMAVLKGLDNKGENGFVKKSNISEFSDESSSSIGKNSDLSENSMGESGDGEEVQSKGALDSMEALEEVLPIRRGISSFYNGKSKSYTSLTHVSSSSSSTKDIGKPENPYTRKRRNQLSCTLHLDKIRTSCTKTNSNFPKKSKTTLALGLAMNKKDGECINSSGTSLSSLRPTDFSPWRSFSLADLQRGAAAAKTSNS